MTGTATDPRAAAFGFAQRKAWVFSAWWYGAIFSFSGVVHCVLAGILGQSAELGIFLAILGTVLAAVGWVLTMWPRFTRKLPKPASDIPRVEQGIRIAPGMIRTLLIASGLGIGALVLFTPKGASPEMLPILGILVAVPLGVAAGLAYTGWLMRNSAELYARWLERR
ncbi:hypothetical protein [Arthrobacter globiformis]|jgi:hypothetical protein|uniref:hypothetical protein n=1 Tax=Arthrobacter globiformis TaxID=1665 RepID=UPI000B42168A|nr:hypothetical protein [Arthrobacter globiformis]